MEFHSTVDVGVVATGLVSMRATIYREHNWVDLQALTTDPSLARGGQHFDDFWAEQEADPEMAQALARARRRLGTSTTAPRQGLAGLRLAAGLSQRQLAEKMGTHQPAIARWERDPEQMTFPTIRQLAQALGVNEQQIFDVQKDSGLTSEPMPATLQPVEQ